MLSNREQAALDQIERVLEATDPQLAAGLASGRIRRRLGPALGVFAGVWGISALLIVLIGWPAGVILFFGLALLTLRLWVLRP
ncbi:MAG: DUF3040 domain-containing protein [Hamadaea sp.]|nr:DUF3040 domain-containing protein [Hamadaea sp.]